MTLYLGATERSARSYPGPLASSTGAVSVSGNLSVLRELYRSLAHPAPRETRALVRKPHPIHVKGGQ